jgi:glycerate kinase
MTNNLRVVLALDKFKGSLTAVAAANAIRDGIRSVNSMVSIDVVPIADGGDGTVDAATASGMTAVPIETVGPTGEPVSSLIAVGDGVGIVELANTCGITLLPDGILAPLDAHTVGLGRAISAALDCRCTDIVVGLGGSASTDGGLGALVGLGARLLDSSGAELPPSARFHCDIAEIDLRGLDPRVGSARFRIATDVDNPLLGAHGAVAVFGTQKGVTAALAGGVEKGLTHVGELLEKSTGRSVLSVPGMGAAGGAAAALTSVLGAEIVSGADFVSDLLGLSSRIAGASLVVTGEGSFDEQTLRGKGPAAVIAEAMNAGATIAVVAGRITLPESALQSLGVARAWSLLDRVAEPTVAMRDAAALLREIGIEIAEWLAA